MSPKDRAEFARVLTGLASLHRVELTTEALSLWWNSMQTWPIDEFRAAASHLAKACQFMPKPYDFEQLRKAHELTSGEAWSQVVAACVHWRNPELLPQGRLARAVQVVGGYRAIAHADAERDLQWLAKRFCAAYEDLTDADSVREALPQLAPPTSAQIASIFSQAEERGRRRALPKPER